MLKLQQRTTAANYLPFSKWHLQGPGRFLSIRFRSLLLFICQLYTHCYTCCSQSIPSSSNRNVAGTRESVNSHLSAQSSAQFWAEASSLPFRRATKSECCKATRVEPKTGYR